MEGYDRSTQMKNFDQLPIEERAYLLCSIGELIATRAGSKHDYSLYAVAGQYVVLQYSIAHNRITDIKILKDHSNLHYFVENMDLSNLL
jgi:hypothetical protein